MFYEVPRNELLDSCRLQFAVEVSALLKIAVARVRSLSKFRRGRAVGRLLRSAIYLLGLISDSR